MISGKVPVFDKNKIAIKRKEAEWVLVGPFPLNA